MMVMVRMMLLYSNVPQVPVFSDELVHTPVQLLYPGALRLDETLLVLDDGGELPQVQNRLHWVFQQAGAHHSQGERREEKEKEKNNWWRAERCTICVSADEKVRCPPAVLSLILLGCG